MVYLPPGGRPDYEGGTENVTYFTDDKQVWDYVDARPHLLPGGGGAGGREQGGAAEPPRRRERAAPIVGIRRVPVVLRPRQSARHEPDGARRLLLPGGAAPEGQRPQARSGASDRRSRGGETRGVGTLVKGRDV